jgi:O-antigen/teichoic acid export membrane protein
MAKYNLKSKIREQFPGPGSAQRAAKSIFSPKTACLAIGTWTFWWCLNKARRSDNDLLKIAAAGSLTTHLVEMSFYFGDTINSRAKVQFDSLSIMRMLNTVLREEGAKALCQGIGATYYGSAFYGLSYFYTYCKLKVLGHDFFDRHNKMPLLYFLSGVVAEYSALFLYYPFETVKVRLQS